ncbi:MAG: prepilin-type N-terminal cleavage/methylation domain-containing protein [Sphingobacteriales bacterium]|nr:MAG: prepilin-type N-terminal cleavage/methylation domain-containing protein [Sphingobacteriales bacterium]
MHSSSQRGFTIVELLIVIVVIGILAAIVIVAYQGVSSRAKIASITSGLTQYSKKINVYNSTNGNYPTSISEAGIKDGEDVSYQYTNTSATEYCLTATSGTMTYYISQASGGVQQGVCSSYNLLVWNESGSPVISGATTDTSESRSAPASMRLGPGLVGRMLNGNPYSGTAGQTYTVSLWIKTANTWNGTNGNSKVRFGAASGGAFLNACGYNGVKTAWVQVSCSYTLTATNTSVGISVGNDGTVGDIWIDDVSVSRS